MSRSLDLFFKPRLANKVATWKHDSNVQDKATAVAAGDPCD
jgi:hypothetical protein